MSIATINQESIDTLRAMFAAADQQGYKPEVQTITATVIRRRTLTKEDFIKGRIACRCTAEVRQYEKNWRKHLVQKLLEAGEEKLAKSFQ